MAVDGLRRAWTKWMWKGTRCSIYVVGPSSLVAAVARQHLFTDVHHHPVTVSSVTDEFRKGVSLHGLTVFITGP